MGVRTADKITTLLSDIVTETAAASSLICKNWCSKQVSSQVKGQKLKRNANTTTKKEIPDVTSSFLLQQKQISLLPLPIHEGAGSAGGRSTAASWCAAACTSRVALLP